MSKCINVKSLKRVMAGWVCPGKLRHYSSSQQLLLTQPIITGINNCACTLETAPSPVAEHLVNQKLHLGLTSPNVPSSKKTLSIVAVLAPWALEIWVPSEHAKVSSWTGSLSRAVSRHIDQKWTPSKTASCFFISCHASLHCNRDTQRCRVSRTPVAHLLICH